MGRMSTKDTYLSIMIPRGALTTSRAWGTNKMSIGCDKLSEGEVAHLNPKSKLCRDKLRPLM